MRRSVSALGLAYAQDVQRVRALFERAGLPTVAPRWGRKYLQLMDWTRKWPTQIRSCC